MTGLPPAVLDAVEASGYRVGWRLVRWLPERVARALFDGIADLTVARGGARRMRANYARVRPGASAGELDRLVHEGMRSYLRYYCEAFRLPGLSPGELAERVRLEGFEAPAAVVAAGGSVVCFLGHLGNWDLAGAWGSVHWAPVTTVAERLEPERVFRDFLTFRESLGMTILPLTGGANPFPALREAARRPGVIPLLADRDLTDRGVTVELCGQPARMAAGPAALALVEDRPLFPVTIRHERRGPGWGIVITFHPAVAPPESGTTREKVAAMTQACADVLGEVIARDPSQWHMLQRVFVADLDGRSGAAAAGGSGDLP